jgi:hypothetical protein
MPSRYMSAKAYEATIAHAIDFLFVVVQSHVAMWTSTVPSV